MGEGAIIGRNHPAIGQHQGIALNRPHLDEFAIDKSFAGRVCLQQQLVPGGDFQFSLFPYITGDACTQWEMVFRTISTLNFERIILDGDH